MSCQDIVIFQVILNIVSALGAQYDKQIPSEQRVAAADKFYHRSLGFVSSDTLDNPAQSRVQLFLLAAVYLRSIAAEKGDIDPIRFLLELGANSNATITIT